MRSVALCCLTSTGLLLAIAGSARGQEWRSEGPDLATATDVAVDPAHPDTVYVGTNGGGVWRTDDGGATWTLPGDAMTSRQVRWILVDPGKPTTVWAGVEDAGMWRSLDRGATWRSVKPEDDELVGLRPAFAPSAPQNVFVPSTNLHWRSPDDGKSWTSFRVGGQDSYSIAVHPTNPKIVLSGGRGQTLNLARSQDGGKTWKPVGVGIKDQSVYRLVFDPKDPSTVYASAGYRNLFKSHDMGDSFEQLDLGLDGSPEISDLDLDASDPKTLWVATEKGLLVSHDGGATWRTSENGTGDYLVAAVTLVPARKGLMFAASKGGYGVYRSTDGGASWSPSNKGVAAGWVQRIWPTPKGTLFAQTGAGLFRREPGGAWAELRRPFEDDEAAELDGILADRASPQTLYAYSGAKYWRSTDGGRTWKEPERKEPGLRQMLRGDLSSAEFKSMAQDAGDAKTFYSGAWSGSEAERSVFKTTDGGKTWKPAAKGLPEGAVTALVSPAAKTVYAVVAKEGVFRTKDGGASWSNAASGLPGGEIRQVAVSPSNPSRLFAATEHGLFGSTDGGDSWQRTDASLSEDDVEAVVFAPDGDLFAGAFEGIYYSKNGGTSWTKMNGALKNVDVRALAVEPGNPGRLYAGFGGGSIWSMALP